MGTRTAMSTREAPIPVRTASRMLGDYLRRLSSLWVEGQVAELKRRRNAAFLTLRDTDTDMSIPVVISLDRLDASAVAVGQRVVCEIRVEYWSNNGSVQWRARQVQAVGLGALMLRLEELRKTLAAEGLFAEERKRPLPFLPRRVGLVCGKRAAAEKDVIVNAQERWPSTQFELREVAVQGAKCVPQVVAALEDLAATPQVDVIVVTRGGGSFEDLLGFSNEAMLRAVSRCPVPVVSAIGHEEDTPLLDLVADKRASTPTAAGKMIVPDAVELRSALDHQIQRLRRSTVGHLEREATLLGNLRQRLGNVSPSRLQTQRRVDLGSAQERMRVAMMSRLKVERDRVQSLRDRPVLARPDAMITTLRRESALTHAALRRCVTDRMRTERQHLHQDLARLTALSPQATLDRGYAVVRQTRGTLVTAAADVRPGDDLNVRVRSGSFDVTVLEHIER